MQEESYRLVESLVSRNAAETRAFGHRLAATLQPGTVLIFTGNLGAGKTTLIQGICAGFGVTATVTSPTFTLINEYPGRLPVYHFDFYRLHAEVELHDLGLEEYLDGEGVCLIEWPELIESWLPAGHRRLHLSHGIEAAGRIQAAAAQAIPITAEVRLIEVYHHEPAGH